MKLKKYFFLLFAFAIFHLASAQTIHKDYQDGIVVFQLNVNQEIIPSTDRMVDFQKEPLFQEILQDFEIREVLQLLPEVRDKALMRTYEVRLENQEDMDQLAKALQQKREVEYAEFKELAQPFANPNDPYYSSQWGLTKINAPAAWDIATGNSSVVVAVTDDGVSVNHPDLVNVLYGGYDAVNNTYDPSGCQSGGQGDHGAHCAGIIGAQTNNGTGVASIGHGVRVMPINVSNCYGNYVAGYEGVAYAVDNGADVINMSWGGGGASQYGQNVMTYAWNNGVIPVAAAGNSNTSTKMYPAGYDNVVRVAASDSNDRRASFSNYGNWIDISAPGVDILSTLLGSNYGYMSGTSMAAPMVSGLLGLMKSYAPNASMSQLLNCLYSTADAMPNESYYNNGWMGHGRINAKAALECLGGQTNQSHDVAIVGIEYPTSQINDNTFVPEIKIKNNGSTNLTSFKLVYSAGGESVETTLEGNLAPGQTSTTYGTPSITLPDGSYTFTATVSLPNGVADEDPSNNTQSSTFQIGEDPQPDPTHDVEIVSISYPVGQIGENTFVPNIEIRNNGTANLTSFKLVYSAGGQSVETTLSGNLAPGQTSTTYGTPSITLADGSYTFTATASQPNGEVDENPSNNEASSNFSIMTTSNVDAGITSISAPGSSVIGSYTYPTVVLKNYGNKNLTSVRIEYQTSIDSYYFNWTGNLQPNQTTSVNLPYIYVGNGNEIMKAQTVNPNGQADSNPSNDMAQKSFYVYFSAYNSNTSWAYNGEEFSEGAHIDIYPNPTVDFVNVSWNMEDEVSEIALIDLLGKQVMHLNSDKNETSQMIDLSRLDSGVYFIQMKTNSGLVNKRIIKK